MTAVLKEDKEAVMKRVQKCMRNNQLEYEHEDMKKNKEVVMAAVQTFGGDLRHAAAEMRKDKEVVMAAVQKDGYALAHAHEDMKKDKEVVMAAVQNFDRAPWHAAAEIGEELAKEAERFNITPQQ